jgi:beta-hydroxylase
MQVQESPVTPPSPELDDRTLRLDVPRSAGMRALLKVKDALERGVATASVHDDAPVYDPALFAWTREVEAGWRDIRAELEALLTRREEMPSFQDILEPVAAINRADDWKTLWLVAMGVESTETARRCPRTMELLGKIPGMTTAFFSILSPGKHIPRHRGAFNGLLRYHLGLIVPEPPDRCFIRVGSRLLSWAEGESLVFDDTFDHEVWNGTDGVRAVLFVDFARPLHPPFDQLNRALLAAGRYTPMMRQTIRNQRQWEQRFYADPADST